MRGFTLIELIVSIGIFMMFLAVGLGALLSLIDANKQARAVSTVVNNVSFALESMAREIRLGTTYYCGYSVMEETQDCATTPFPGISFTSQEDPYSGARTRISYRVSGGTQLQKQVGAGGAFQDVLGSEVELTEFHVFVSGSDPLDPVQPKATLIIRGFTKEEAVGVRTPINVQTTVSQRIFDLN